MNHFYFEPKKQDYFPTIEKNLISPVSQKEKFSADRTNFSEVLSSSILDSSSNNNSKINYTSLDQGNKDFRENVERIIRNIVNSNNPAYQEELPIKDKNGNYLKSKKPGILEKTEWPLDFAISGPGQGLKLKNGKYTKDGRFSFDQNGRIVSLKEGVPLEIEFKDFNKTNFSNRQLKVDFDGSIKDKITGEYLGKIKFEGARIHQGFLEMPKINVPIKMMELKQMLKSLSLAREIRGFRSRFASQFIESLRSL